MMQAASSDCFMLAYICIAGFSHVFTYRYIKIASKIIIDR